MFRLFAASSCNALWECSHFVASCVVKRRSGSFLLAKHHLPRPLSTGTPRWKDALQVKSDKAEETETLDLDKWKSVMRSRAAFEEKQATNEAEESNDGENMQELDSDLKAGASLEATRELVVMWREAGKLVPKEITDEELEALAKLTTKSSRKKYLKFLAVKEGHKLARKAKQERKKIERETLKKERSNAEGEDDEPKLKNTPFLSFWSRSLDRQLAWRCANAMIFGQPLVIDMSYESNMSRREIENTVSQLMEVEAWNRRASDPFHLHFCNLQPDGQYKQELLKRYGTETWDRLFITDTDRQHVEVFPKQQLVYLTADSPNLLRTFDHSKVYIIGALVDRSIQKGLSLANAKRLKLATARLPLDEFLHWDIGAKNLTLDQMIRIMLTLKESGKWEEALKFVPQRKHDGFHQQQEQMNRRDIKHKPRADNEGPSWLRDTNGSKTPKRSDQIFPKARKDSGFSVRDRVSGSISKRENLSASTTVRSSLKSLMEAKKKSGKQKM
ncbi:tRNA methyltransferase 10 homolog C [Salarias fasciatus]|uniref:tRNA methyltransferase 10 homolog C n=1 Tax=Salarias fasciatus TaxID=181472 RepID=UPI0011767122|nr:tRNA methyltransferase 10 homolog C [Salarias fasciatus]